MSLYSQSSWRELRSRVVSGDANCVLSGLAGECRGRLHVHHIKPVSEGGPEIPTEDGVAVLCARHHRAVHGFLRRQDDPSPDEVKCPHHHPYPEGRRLCEERMRAALIAGGERAA